MKSQHYLKNDSLLSQFPPYDIFVPPSNCYASRTQHFDYSGGFLSAIISFIQNTI